MKEYECKYFGFQNRRLNICAIILILFLMSSCDLQQKGLILSGIHDLSELATTEVVVKKYVLGSQKKYLFFIKVSETKFGASSKAYLKFGVDLSQLTSHDIEIVGSTLVISIPEIKLVSFDYPIEEAREDLYLTDRFAFANKLDASKMDCLFKGAQHQIGLSIPHMNITKTVLRNTERVLEGLVSKFGYEDVILKLKSQEIVIDKYFDNSNNGLCTKS